MKKAASLVLMALLCVVAPASAATPLHVVTSFSILADMTRNIGGDAVEVKALVGPDADTHTYQPTPEDAKLLAAADLVVVNGLGFEGWMQRLISASGYKGKVIVASEGVKPRTMIDDDDKSAKEVTDPHAWQDISNGRIYAHNIADALVVAAPAKFQAIKSREGSYDKQLADADVYVRKEFSGISPTKRKIITSHDAFGYFGAAYGVKFMAPVGLSTEAEPSAADVAKLIGQIKTEHAKELFFETMASPRLIEQIAKDTGAKVGGALYSDALSAADGPAPTYLKMFYNNVPKLKEAMR